VQEDVFEEERQREGREAVHACGAGARCADKVNLFLNYFSRNAPHVKVTAKPVPGHRCTFRDIEYGAFGGGDLIHALI